MKNFNMMHSLTKSDLQHLSQDNRANMMIKDFNAQNVNMHYHPGFAMQQ